MLTVSSVSTGAVVHSRSPKYLHNCYNLTENKALAQIFESTLVTQSTHSRTIYAL